MKLFILIHTYLVGFIKEATLLSSILLLRDTFKWYNVVPIVKTLLHSWFIQQMTNRLYFFLFLQENRCWHFMRIVFIKQCAWTVKVYFLGTIRKLIKLPSLKFIPNMRRVTGDCVVLPEYLLIRYIFARESDISLISCWWIFRCSIRNAYTFLLTFVFLLIVIW